MKKHIHSVESLAAGSLGLPEKSGFLRLIDNISYYKSRTEQRCVFDDRIVNIRNHTHRSCIDQQITLCNGILQSCMIVIVEKTDLASGFGCEILSKFLSTVPVSAGTACEDMYGTGTIQSRLSTDCHRSSTYAHNCDIFHLLHHALHHVQTA